MAEYFELEGSSSGREIKPARRVAYRTQRLDSVLTEIGPLPDEALFLGMASDGLPMLLNLHDPVPGPILIVGEEQSGKTAFLKNVAAAAEKTHSSEDLQYAVLTTDPSEWNSVGGDNMVAVFDIKSPEAEDLLLSLASWAHGNKSSRQSVVLMIDGLDKVDALSFDALQNLRWLLLRGASRKVWTMATYGADRDSYNSMLEAFRTRIYGNISAGHNIGKWDLKGAETESLQSGVQFQITEGNKWTRFWIPQ